MNIALRRGLILLIKNEILKYVNLIRERAGIPRI